MSNALLVPPPHQGPAIPYQELLDAARESLPAHLPRNAKEILLALDVDGTLLLPEGASPRVRRTLGEALEAGVNVVIATGRGIDSTRPVFAELQLPDGYSVSSNGAQTVHWSRDKDAPESQEGPLYVPQILIEHVFQHKPSAMIMLDAIPGLLLGVDDGTNGMLVTETFPGGEMLSRQHVVPIARLLDGSTPRMVARAPWMDRDQFDMIVRELPLEDVAVAVGWTAWADICPD